MTIKIVTDSTCDLPEATAARYDITVVPAYINIDNHSYLDGVELSRQQFYENLASYKTPPTTAAPASGSFTEVYEDLAARGATEVLSIHVAASLSGVLNAARLGSEATHTVRVTLFDSKQLTMGLGLLVLKAAKAAATGCSMAEITALLNERVAQTHVLALLDTLEFLRRSGRVSWAQFGLGTLLKIKPLLHVYKGEVKMVEKIRTRTRALERLVQVVSDLGPLEQVALLHTNVPEAAAALRQQAGHLFPDDTEVLAVEVTPAVGAHVGPGAVGFACIVAT